MSVKTYEYYVKKGDNMTDAINMLKTAYKALDDKKHMI